MPISYPPYMPIAPRERPNIDIAGTIGGLGDALQQGLEYGRKRRIEHATQQAFADGIPMGPDGSPDYGAMAARLFQLGDVQTGMGLTRLAETAVQNAYLRGRPQIIGGAETGYFNVNPQGGGQPQEVIPGRPPKKQRQMGLNAAGEVVQQEYDPATGEWTDISGPKKQPPRSRALSNATVTDLTEAGQNAIDVNRLVGTWSDDYAGYGVGGGLANLAGANLPGSRYQAQAEWWQDYQTRRNDLRHSKFGASLTPGEKAEFEKADINPNMQPAVIKKNLARQQQIVNNAARRLAKVWIRQGYDAQAISEAVGITPEDLGVQPDVEEGAATPGSTENAAPEQAPAPAEPAPPPEPAPQQTAPQATGGPQEGERRSIGGKVYIFENGEWWEE